MRSIIHISSLALVLSTGLFSTAAYAEGHNVTEVDSVKNQNPVVQLGPRPYFLVEDMDEGPLKTELQQCAATKKVFHSTDFSIGHRGAPLQFPEHTKESYVAAAQMGAGILECDVTFTQDRELVCRHAQCDLHTTTNILETPLAAKCSQGFTPAVLNPDGSVAIPASAKCCTSDITLAEFKTLKGKMDAANPAATTVSEYLDGTPNFRTDLYSSRGTLLTHAESIELFKNLGAKFTPELKSPEVPMPYGGDYTQEDYAQQLIDEYVAAGIPPRQVWAQSFNLNDVLYWIQKTPQYGQQAVWLDGRYADPSFDVNDPSTYNPSMSQLAGWGVNIVAPPMQFLLTVPQGSTNASDIVESNYAKAAKSAGLDIITWTLERSGPLASGGGFYYSTVSNAINNDGDMLHALDVITRDVGVLGIFTDWPATVTFYENCLSFLQKLGFNR